MKNFFRRFINFRTKTGESTVKNIRVRGLWLVSLAMLVALATFVLQLDSTTNGRFMPAVHGDWASHAATTRAIFLGEDFSSDAIKVTLNEFAIYPRLTYKAASDVAHSFGLSPLQGLSIVVQLSMIFVCLFYSLRLCAVFSEKKINLFFISLSLLYILFCVHILRIGFRDLVISNSFISQLTSLAIAQLFLYLSVANPKPKYLVALMALSAWILINTHIIGFVWCAASLIIMALGLPNANAKTRVVVALIGATIAGAILLTSQGVLEMIKIAGTGGDLRAWKGVNLSDYGSIVVVFISTYVFAFAAAIWRCKQKYISYAELFWHGSSFISLGPLIVLSAVTVLNKGGNWYPVVKWIYLFFSEFLIIFFLIVSNKLKSQASGWRSGILITVFFIVVFSIQYPYFLPNVDLEPAILAENGVGGETVSFDRRYPGLHVDHPALNFFIAKSVLKIPMDAVTFSWISNGFISNNSLGPEDFISVAPHVHSGETIYFRLGNSFAQRMLTNKWWPLEPDHVWASRSPATMFFIATTHPKKIQISGVPFMPQGPRLRKYTIILNGERMPDMTAYKMNWSEPTIYSIDVPPGLINPDGRVKLNIEWVPIVNDDLGFAMTSLKYE